MQDVPVLAVDDHPGAAQEQRTFRTVTVEVDPQDAQKLALAQQVGRLALTLRGFVDPGIEPAPTIPRRPPRRPEGCRRPWSGYRDIRENILRPDLCRSSLDGVIGPALGIPHEPVRLRRGDFGVPRGLCERPPISASRATPCDVMDFLPSAS